MAMVLQRDINKFIEDADKTDAKCPQFGTYISKQDMRILDAKLADVKKHIDSFANRVNKEAASLK